MNTKPSRVTCGHAQHRVLLGPDGMLQTPDHPDAAENGQRVAALARLGRPVSATDGCGSLAALIAGAEILAPCLLAVPEGMSGATGRVPIRASEPPAVWKSVLNAYGHHSLFRCALAAADAAARGQYERDARRFMAAMERWAGWERQQVKLALGLAPDIVASWDLVGFGQHDVWHVPVQKHWADLEENGLSLVDSKLVVGQSALDPREVYALSTGNTYTGWRVRTFRYVDKRLVST